MSTVGHVKTHIKERHLFKEEARKYKCVCGKRFTRSNHLKRHKLTCVVTAEVDG